MENLWWKRGMDER